MQPPMCSEAKAKVLEENATLNPHPERVSDVLFQSHPFFDPYDLVQVRYEMLRRVMAEEQAVGTTAAAFGYSRVTLHHLRQCFERQGMAGLLPQPKGPLRASKMTEKVLDFVERMLETEPELCTADLPQRLEQEFGISIHGRSIARALARRRKKSEGHSGLRHFPPPLRGWTMPSSMNDCDSKPCTLIRWPA